MKLNSGIFYSNDIGRTVEFYSELGFKLDPDRN
jgi:predicted lactoylglutathione lyase